MARVGNISIIQRSTNSHSTDAIGDGNITECGSVCRIVGYVSAGCGGSVRLFDGNFPPHRH